MTTRKQPMVTLRLSRFVILCLALVAAGAVAHDWLAGRAMWEFYRAEAAVLVAEAEKAFREQAAYSTKHSARVHRQMADACLAEAGIAIRPFVPPKRIDYAVGEAPVAQHTQLRK